MGYGGRIDHTISNIHILKETLDRKIPTRIIDEKNEIEPEEFMKKLEKYIKTRFERFIYK